MANVMPITQNEVFWLWNPSTKSYDREEREITYNRPDQIGVRGAQFVRYVAEKLG